MKSRWYPPAAVSGGYEMLIGTIERGIILSNHTQKMVVGGL